MIVQCIVGNCLNKFENHFHKSGLLKQTMAMQSLLIICWTSATIEQIVMIKYCWMQIKMLLDVALQVNIYLVYMAYTIICVIEVQKCNTTQLEKIIFVISDTGILKTRNLSQK